MAALLCHRAHIGQQHLQKRQKFTTQVAANKLVVTLKTQVKQQPAAHMQDVRQVLQESGREAHLWDA